MTHNLEYSRFVAYISMFTAYSHLLTIIYVNQQSINKVPKIWGEQNEKGIRNGGLPGFWLARLSQYYVFLYVEYLVCNIKQ